MPIDYNKPVDLSELPFHDLLEDAHESRLRLEAITGLCRRHAHAGCVTSTHLLAAKVLQLAEGRKESGEGVRDG